MCVRATAMAAVNGGGVGGEGGKAEVRVGCGLTSGFDELGVVDWLSCNSI